MRTVRVKWVVPIALVVALVAGCGSEKAADGAGTPSAPATTAAPAGLADKLPKDIIEEAKAALKEAKSYRMKGDLTTDGELISLDLTTNGTDIKGSMSMKGQGKVELLAVGDKQFIRPDLAFWQANVGAQGKQVAQLIGKKWVAVTDKDQDLSDLFTFTNVDELLTSSGFLAKTPVKEVNGVQAVGLSDAGPDGGTLWISTEGEPYPLMIEGASGGTDKMVFSDFGKTFDIKAPAKAEIVDLDKLANG
jgi:hypothetical protein